MLCETRLDQQRYTRLGRRALDVHLLGVLQTALVATKDSGPPPGERVAFHVEEDASVRVMVDDGVTLLVKPIVLDVLRGEHDGKPVYYVQSVLNVIVKPAKEGA